MKPNREESTLLIIVGVAFVTAVFALGVFITIVREWVS